MYGRPTGYVAVMSEQQPEETDESTTQDSQQDTSSSGGTEQSSSSSTSSSSGTEVDSGEPGEVSDDRLPEDLRPTEDNPLARHPDQTGDEDDAIGQDTEGEPQTAPLHEGQADYGSGESDSSGGSGNTGGDGTQDGRADAEESDGSEELENGGGGAG